MSNRSKSLSHRRLGWIIIAAVIAVLLCFPVYVTASMDYAESKGPFKNLTQVVDLDGDGDLDILVSHTRWEAVSISWAGVGRWINQGDGTFELVREQGTEYFAGFAGGAGDVDQDGDADVFVQNFGIRLLQNQGGLQGGQPGQFMSSGGINAPPAYAQGYRDMGGSIITGDLNGDGRLDAFVAGCCYGLNPLHPGNDSYYAPSVSWAWLNDGREKFLQTGHILALDALNGTPIRQAALGDLDGDGDLDLFAAVGRPTLGMVASPGSLVLLNDGAGNLAPMPLLDASDSTSVALGDVSGDGRLDALVGTSDGARLWINQGVDPGSGAPVFALADQDFKALQNLGSRLQAGISTAAGRLGLYLPYGSPRTQSVFLADLDSDGDLDALIGRLFGAEIWWNDGQGAFSRSGDYFNYKEDTGLAVGDFDGDGAADIFIGRNESEYQVLWGGNK
jgi:hypothetical protein